MKNMAQKPLPATPKNVGTICKMKTEKSQKIPIRRTIKNTMRKPSVWSQRCGMKGMYNSITGSTGLGIFVLNLSGAALLQSRNNMLVRQVAMLVLNSTLTVEVLCDPIPPPNSQICNLIPYIHHGFGGVLNLRGQQL